MKPQLVTFTGIDERTDFARVRSLSLRFPVEWAVLFSPDRQGLEPRYPGGDVIKSFRAQPRIYKAAHLCGEYARAVMVGLGFTLSVADFGRVQINHRAPSPDAISRFSRERCTLAIMQVRELEFPDVPALQMLFDRSGGNGKAPAEWPRHPGGDRLVGYAGGISPANIHDVLAAIDSSGPYWIDMESGVRTDDWLDLDKCEAVLEAVYGQE